ncbi:hypothetical protein FA09DRAFT_173026 [Tilletiopsis washingtonensis]|uniref:Uncharacterized protein n=1 Tax=Tilletiopsis washingtonensis TaxID=58919 RepID=A0A316Z3B8_9BASI|nr:hypothetical protein FA09DRAFT_173026 [Tilletiopsis washingtonensis]PWN94683.1 hypothetical protein FA09DRAFT_173026 [Tilletiopsis washingtonensis]
MPVRLHSMAPSSSLFGCRPPAPRVLLTSVCRRRAHVIAAFAELVGHRQRRCARSGHLLLRRERVVDRQRRGREREHRDDSRSTSAKPSTLPSAASSHVTVAGRADCCQPAWSWTFEHAERGSANGQRVRYSGPCMPAAVSSHRRRTTICNSQRASARHASNNDEVLRLETRTPSSP